MKHLYLSLFWKIILGISAIILISGLVSGIFIWHHVGKYLETESQKRGHSIVHLLATQLKDPMFMNDRTSLQKLIDNITEIDPSIAYIFILGDTNEVIVYTHNDAVPAGIIEAYTVQSGQTESVAMIKTNDNSNGIIRDIAHPVGEGNVGTIRVGITEDTINMEVKNTIRTLLITMGVLFIIGGIGASLFALYISNPIKVIIRGTESISFQCILLESQPRIALHEKTPRLLRRFQFRDDLDVLADKLNEMVERLTNAYCELESTQANLIQSEKLASIGTLAAEIAHEINNPIAGLKNCIRRLQKDPKNLLQNKRYLDMMGEATLKMEGIVCGLLDYTRYEELIFEEIDIEKVIEKALLLISYKIDIYQIEIINNIKGKIPKIPGSFSHLEQVFVNLFVNAINAINEICKVDTACQRNIYISAEVEESFLNVQVRDTGAGIPSTDRERIFDPFYTTKEIGMGTGLGLSICHNIIKAHHGEIRVESQIGKGTAFLISLPLRIVES